MSKIQPPRVEKVGNVLVVRDDELPGGTKRRILDGWLRPGVEYVYAGPAYGYAQLALAYAAADAGARATLFVALRGALHERTAEAARQGANVVQIPYGYLSNVTAKAREYCERTGAVLVPFGLDTREFEGRLAAVARALLPEPPVEFWTVAGSGMLSRSLQRAWPGTRAWAVQIGKETDAGRAVVLVAPEKFEHNAELPPPFASCSNYDAKAWRFVHARAAAGALFWNVGR